MTKIFLYFSVFFLITLNCFSQDFYFFEKKIYVHNGDTLPYRILLPQNYNINKHYPMVLFLHGAGERGSNNEKQLTHGAKMFLEDSIRKNYPSIVDSLSAIEQEAILDGEIVVVGEDGKANFQDLQHLCIRRMENPQKLWGY